MTSVIDTLVLELGLDTSKFNQGQQDAIKNLRSFEDAATRSANTTESQGKRIVETLSSFRREFLYTLGLFFGGRGVGEFVNWITKVDAATGRLAYTMNQSAGEVSEWQSAFEQMGGTAEGANSALSGLSSEMHRFQLTGQSQMLPVLSRLGISLYDSNQHLKTSSELWLELADAVQGMDPADATAFLQMIPGANQDMINFALMGRKAMEQYLADARRARTLTDENVEGSKEWIKQMGLLERAAISVGERFAMWALPTTFVKSLSDLMSKWNFGSGSPEGEAVSKHNRADSVRRFGSPHEVLSSINEILAPLQGAAETAKWRGILDSFYAGDSPGRAAFAARLRASNARTSLPTPEARERFIRATAAQMGIDPEQAMTVARSEGFFRRVGDQGSSFGDFQLHYGGIAPGGNSGPGLGDDFTKQTGLDAKNSSNWQAADAWALAYASQHGWGNWHGWKGAPYAGIGGGRSGGSTTITVNGITIVTQATDAAGIARDIDSALKRSVTAGGANNGGQ